MSLVVLLICMLLPAAALAVPRGGSDTMGCPGQAGKTWYFAEGNTRPGFSEYICLLNPGSNVALTDFTYMLSTGETIARKHDLVPNSRTTIEVAKEVPANCDVSLKVTSSEPIVAERPMYFVYNGAWSGGHDVLGAAAPSSEWYFAEGTTRDGFDSYLCLQNPGDSDASANIDYYLVDGTKRSKTGITIKARSRFTVSTYNDDLGIGRHNDASGDFSVKVTTSEFTPLVVERPTYFSYRPYLYGGDDVMGALKPLTDWYFAEGCTRPGFDTYLCLSNPGTDDAKVDISYFCGNGQVVEKKGITVGRGSRSTIIAHDEVQGIGRADSSRGDFSARVHSANGVPVVAERVTYFFYKPFWSGGHDVVGASQPANTWLFSEGTTRQGFDTYICIANPGDQAAKVNITYYRGDGQQETKGGIDVAPRSRSTIAVHETGNGIGRRDDSSGDVSIKVESSNGVPVVAERPMYFAERWRTMDRTAIANAWGWGNLSHGNRTRPCVAFTFDCENNASNTGQILDILKAKGIHATCFLLNNVAQSQSVVTRIANEGHEIGSHGVSHAQFTKIPASQVVSELATVEATVNREVGYTTKPYFRFPYGEMNSGLVAQVNSLGYYSCYWTVDAQEWSASNSVDKVIATIISQAAAGSIILMHDIPKTIAALPAVIDGVRAKGLVPVTMTELLYPGP